MIHFTIKNSYTYVSGPNIPLGVLLTLCELKESVYKPGYAGRKGSYQTERHYLYDHELNRFPTGWLFDVLDYLDNSGISYTESYERTEAPELPIKGCWDRFDGDRDYQETTILEAIDRSRGVAVIGTGGGKTYTYARIIEELQTTALIIVPTKNLLNQVFAGLNAIYPHEVGKIGGGGKWDVKQITVALPHSLYKATNPTSPNNAELIEIQDLFGAVLVDEAHKIQLGGMQQWYNTVMWFDAYYKLGFTGTPDPPKDPNRRLMEACLGGVLVEFGIEHLTAEGWLREADLIIHDIPMDGSAYTEYKAGKNGTTRQVFTGKWLEVWEEQILMNDARNDVIASIAREYAEGGHTVLIAVTRIETQGRELWRRLSDIAVFIHGETKDNQEVLDKLSRRELSVVIGTGIGIGIDIPSLDVVIRAYGENEAKNVIQLAGRVVRDDEHKKNCVIIDFNDMDGSLLQRHSTKRLRAYRKEGFRPRAADTIALT